MISKIGIFSICISSFSWACDKSIVLWTPRWDESCKEDADAIAELINGTDLKPNYSLYNLLKDKNFHERIETLEQKLRNDTLKRIEKNRISKSRNYYCYTIDTKAQQCSQSSIKQLTLLEYCLYTHTNDAIPSLIKNGAEISKSLHWAINGHNYKGAALLIKKYNAWAHDVDENDNTPLLTLCKQRISNDTAENVAQLSLLRLLLQKGAHINTINNRGCYPVYVAASNLNYLMLPILLEYKPKIQRTVHVIEKFYRIFHIDLYYHLDPLARAIPSCSCDPHTKESAEKVIDCLLSAGANPYHYRPKHRYKPDSRSFLERIHPIYYSDDIEPIYRDFVAEHYETIKNIYKNRCHNGYTFFRYYAGRKGIEQTIPDTDTQTNKTITLPILPKSIILKIFNYAVPWSTRTHHLLKQKYRIKKQIQEMIARSIAPNIVRTTVLKNKEELPSRRLLGIPIEVWVDRRIEKDLNREYVQKINDLSQITCAIL